MTPEWKIRLDKDARSKKICAEYHDLISRAETKDDLIGIYKRGIDWSLENDCPSLEFLRGEAKDFEYRGLFIDHHFNGELLDEHQVYIFHNCTGEIRVGLNIGKRIIPMLYFANGCDMKVLHGGDSVMPVRIPLYIFGSNHILSETSDSVTFKTYVK
jgi:hypothetical protein